jgi:Halocarboxylic acid dehydrogenase DehI
MTMKWKRHSLDPVSENAATGRTQEIFEDIKQTLRVPHVHMMFQVLAAFPDFFDLFWQTAKPALETQEFFSSGERLAAEAYTRVHNYFRINTLSGRVAEIHFSPEVQAEIQEVVDLHQYAYSTLLLVAAALVQAIEYPGAERQNSTAPARPAHFPEYRRKPIEVEEDLAPLPTKKIYDDIKRTLGTPFVDMSYLNLARWPEFLEIYWDSLKPVLKTPLYEQQRLAIRESGLSLAAELPEPLQLSNAHMEEAGVPRNQISPVIQITDLLLNLLSKQNLNVAFARIGLENGAKREIAA